MFREPISKVPEIVAAHQFTSPQLKSQEYLQSEKVFIGNPLFVPNEASLEVFAPMIDALDGGILATGFDQLFDLLTMSKCNFGVAVDIDNRVSLASRALMELGMFHKWLYHVYPTPAQLIQYFADENIADVEKIMSRILKESDIKILITSLSEGMSFPNHTLGKITSYTRYSLHDYLCLKASDCFNNSWLSSQAKLAHVLDLYNRGQCIIVHNDLTNIDNMNKIAQIANELGFPFNILYLSNVESLLAVVENTVTPALTRLFESLQHLSTSDQTVMLRTSFFHVDDWVKPQMKILQDPLLSRFFSSWHYNAQRYSDWRSKVKKNTNYLHSGWSRELSAKHRLSTGVSAVGFTENITMMPGPESPTQPNFRTESWRQEKISTFDSFFEITMHQINKLFGDVDVPEFEVTEWYNPNIESAYFIHGIGKIKDKMPMYALTWNPVTNVLDRYEFALEQQGEGLGTNITKLTEELACDLGAVELVLSAITNERWKESLLRKGFRQDPLRGDAIFKPLT